MARMRAVDRPFFEPAWRRWAIVAGGLLGGLVVFFLGYSYVGTAVCAVFFWLGYELLVVFNDDTGRRRKPPVEDDA